jgi:VCBS repeat-containing protein
VPVANDDTATTAEDTPVPITLTASDVDGDALTYSTVAVPANGSLSGSAPNMTYTPNNNFNGTDSFTFKANDGTVDSNEATVSITIDAVNDTPVADAQSVTTDENTPVAITLTASDVDGDSLTYSVVTTPDLYAQ